MLVGASLYRAFNKFGQAKFRNGGRLKPIFKTASAASKNTAQFKKGSKLTSK